MLLTPRMICMVQEGGGEDSNGSSERRNKDEVDD